MKKNTEKNPYQTYGYTVEAPNKKKAAGSPNTTKGGDLRVGGKK